jgi:hypothetical protein
VRQCPNLFIVIEFVELAVDEEHHACRSNQKDGYDDQEDGIPSQMLFQLDGGGIPGGQIIFRRRMDVLRLI